MEQNYLVFVLLVWIITIIMARLNGLMYKKMIQDLTEVNNLRSKVADKEAVNILLNQHITSLEALIKLSNTSASSSTNSSSGSSVIVSATAGSGTRGVADKPKRNPVKKNISAKSKKQLNG